MQNKSAMIDSIKVRIECLGNDADEKITFFDAAVVDADGILSFEGINTKVDFRAIPLPTIGEKLVKALIRTNIGSEPIKEESEDKKGKKSKEKETEAPIKKIADALLIFNELESWQQEITEQENAAIYLIKIDPNAKTDYQESTEQLPEQNRSMTVLTINTISVNNAQAILIKIGKDHYHKLENPTQEVKVDTIIDTPTTQVPPLRPLRPESIEWNYLRSKSYPYSSTNQSNPVPLHQ